MKVLGIDSSGMVASVAVVEDTQMLAEYTINYKKTHSQTLLPMLDEIGKMIELDLSTVECNWQWQQVQVLLPVCASVLQLPRDWDWH